MSVSARQKKSDHVTPIMLSLHWLPVEYRNQYKILLLTHKYVHGSALGYLSSLLQPYEPSHALRSAKQYLLKENKMRLKSYGDRAFPDARHACGTRYRLTSGNVKKRIFLRGISKHTSSTWLLTFSHNLLER